MIPFTDGTNILTIAESPATLRPYDFNLGDERKFTYAEALERARVRVKDRGCRQQIRRQDVDPADRRLVPVWLIQDAR